MSIQHIASWCFSHALCRYCAWRIQVNLVRIFVTFVHRINKQEKYCLFFDRILTSRYYFRVGHRMKIERLSDMINMLDESTLNYNISLPWKIKKIASWMSVKRSEINNWSRIIKTVLKYLFFSSSCCQTCFPKIVRPMNKFEKLIPKMKLDSSEKNRPIVFSMYFLWMTKKMNHILRNLVLGERIFPWLFNVNPIFSFHGNDSWWRVSRFFFFCGFAFAFGRHAKSFALSWNAWSSSWSSGISVPLLFKSITNLFDPWEILTKEWVLSLLKDIILISIPCLSCK